MQKARLWFARVVAAYAFLLFGFLAYLYVFITGCVVAVRLYGMALDGVTPVQLSELRNEGVSLLFFVAAILLHPHAADPSKTAAPG